MSNKVFQHKNFESDTVHGHSTHLAEKNMHYTMDKENQSHSENGNFNANKLCDDYEKREMQREKENIARRAEYREFLLKQILDKEKKSDHEETTPMTPFSEETLERNEKFCLKLQKQKEAKQGLDDCMKMKHDLRLISQRTEIEEEQKRSEFWKKHDVETIHTLEKAKLKSERKEHTKNEVALLWMEEKRKDINRKKISALIEDDSITDLNEHQKELSELQKSIRMKQVFVKMNEEKIEEWTKNLEFGRKEQETLKNEIELEEELEQKLKLKCDAMQNASIVDEVDRSKQVLQG